MERSSYRFEVSDYSGLVVGRSFDAACYNQQVRYSVNLRSYLRGFIRELKRAFESRAPTPFVEGKLPPVPYYRQPAQMVKMSIYIDDSLIVQRLFKVKRYNPQARYSQELQQVTDRIVRSIQRGLWQRDCHKIWEDQIITNYLNCDLRKANRLTKHQRQKVLEKAYGDK